MRTFTIIASLLIVLCGVATFVLITGGGAPDSAPIEVSPVAEESPSKDGALVRAGSGRMEARREAPVTAFGTEELASGPAEGQGSAPPDGIVVRGTVRWSGDGEAVPHLRIMANGGGKVRFPMVSDESGDFVSEPVLGPGQLRFWQMGEAPRPAGVPRYPRGLRFAREVFVVPDGADEFEVELVLERPARRLLVEVRDRFAQLVEGAAVSLETLVETKGGLEHDFRSQTTDQEGIAGFALYEVERIQALGLFSVLSDADGSGPALVSDHRSLDLPLPLTDEVRERLVLDVAARLVVRTVDESGMPIADRWVWLDLGAEPLFVWLPDGGVTNADGEKRFDALPSGTYGVAAQAGPGQVHEQVKLTRGAEQEVELVLPGGMPRLAVSGIVLDERGAPLQRAEVTVLYGPRPGSGDTRSARRTDEQGRFEFHAPPCDGLTVLLDGYLQGDEFSPSSINVPFGEKDLVFRRTRTFARRELDLEILDADTGERVERALVMTVRSPGTESYEFRSVKGGLLTIVVSEHPDVRLVIDAAGYRRRSLSLSELVRPDPAGRLHRVTLEKGLLLSIEVHGRPGDGRDETTLEGAEIWEGTRRIGVTDSAGRLDIDLRHWPTQALRVEARGHHPTLWSPTDGFAEPGPAQVRLEPLAADTESGR